MQFAQIFKKPPEKLLAALVSELDRLKVEGHAAIEIDEIRSLCSEIKALKAWRDPRIHARVEFSEHGIALYDWRTRKQLDMAASDCNRNCDLAVSFALRLAGTVRSLLHEIKADEALVNEIRILLDPPDQLGKC